MLPQKKKNLAIPRCIYTRRPLNDGTAESKSSWEHIVPLSLGGSNQFTTRDVRADANSLAGNKIDDIVAQQLPYLMLRHEYTLVGNRKTIPNVKLSGEFTDVSRAARVDISPAGDLTFEFRDEQEVRNGIIHMQASRDRLKFLMKARLEQAKLRKMRLMTRWGEITDEEDIEVAIEFGEIREAKLFKARLAVDLNEMYYAQARLMTKIAIGLGHRVLGPSWTFGPGAQLLQNNLFRTSSDKTKSHLRGTLYADLPPFFVDMFGLSSRDRHIFAVLPSKKTTAAVISLFAGQMGTCVIDLGYDSRRLVANALNTNVPFPCAFSIPLAHPGARPLETRSLQEIGNYASINGLLP